MLSKDTEPHYFKFPLLSRIYSSNVNSLLLFWLEFGIIVPYHYGPTGNSSSWVYIALLQCGPGKRSNAILAKFRSADTKILQAVSNMDMQALPYPYFKRGDISFQQCLACLVEILIKSSKLQHSRADPSSTKRLPWTVWAVHSVHKSTWVWQRVMPWFEWCDGVSSSLLKVRDRLMF